MDPYEITICWGKKLSIHQLLFIIITTTTTIIIIIIIIIKAKETLTETLKKPSKKP